MFSLNALAILRESLSSPYRKIMSASSFSSKVLTTSSALITALMPKRMSSGASRYLLMKQIDEDIAIIHRLYSEGWERNWGEVPMTEEEFRRL